jgi:hypothetical protein
LVGGVLIVTEVTGEGIDVRVKLSVLFSRRDGGFSVPG